MNAFDGPLILGVSGWIVFLISLTASRFAAHTKTLPDHPNIRSSHSHVTSKAGGLAFMGAWLIGTLVFCLFYGVSPQALFAAKLAGLAILAMALGWADDHWTLSPLVKGVGQVLIAFLFMIVFSPLQIAPLPFVGDAALGVFGPVITFVWIFAFMNAFNFMDGANGIASGCAALGLCAFGVMAGGMGAVTIGMLSILLAVAVIGFFPTNFSRGRLFMGDNGSQALSFLIAALAVLGANDTGGRLSIFLMPVIFAPFIFDVVWTLGHRLLRKQNILQAHREHLYQLQIRMGRSHKQVAILYMGLTALSAAVAIVMLRISPAWQWVAPFFLGAVFIAVAIRVHNAAVKSELFDGDIKPEQPAPA